MSPHIEKLNSLKKQAKNSKKLEINLDHDNTNFESLESSLNKKPSQTIQIIRKILAFLILSTLIYIPYNYFKVYPEMQKYGQEVNMPMMRDNPDILDLPTRMKFYFPLLQNYFLALLLVYVIAYIISPNVRGIGKRVKDLDEMEKETFTNNLKTTTILSLLYIGIFMYIDNFFLNKNYFGYNIKPLPPITILYFSLYSIISIGLVTSLINDKSDNEFSFKNRIEKDSPLFKSIKNLFKVLTILGIFTSLIAGGIWLYGKKEIVKEIEMKPTASFDLTGNIDAVIKIDPTATKTKIKYSGSVLRVNAVETISKNESNRIYTHESLRNTPSILIQTSTSDRLWRPEALKVEIVTPKLEVVDAYGASVKIEGNCGQNQDIPQSFSAAFEGKVYVDCAKNIKKVNVGGMIGRRGTNFSDIYINGQKIEPTYDPALTGDFRTPNTENTSTSSSIPTTQN